MSTVTTQQTLSTDALALSTAELNATMDYQPNLMPFHIEYDGPAPVSTYMKVEVVKRGVGMPDLATEAGPESKSGDVDMKDETGNERRDEKGNANNANADGAEEGKGSGSCITEDRYVSTFRGRTIHGLDVRLPGGYSGLILRTEDSLSKEAGKGRKTKDKGKSKDRSNDSGAPQKAEGRRMGRRTRSTAREVVCIDGDGDEEVEDGDNSVDEAASETRVTKVLVPGGRFSTVRVWEADKPVDGGQNEYVRGLGEWTRLAAEVSLCLKE